MASAERGFVLLAFLLVGAVVGYVTFLIFRIAVRQQRFDWTGALSVITSLAGGGFLSYRSQPQNFAAYGIGFFAGFAAYWRLLQSDGMRTGSTAACSDDSLRKIEESGSAVRGLGSQAASKSTPGFGVRLNPDTGLPMGPPPLERPDYTEDLLRTTLDTALPTEPRVKALLALRTEEHSENISVTNSLRNDLSLNSFDLLLVAVILGLPLPTRPSSLPIDTVRDLINFIDGKP